MSSKDQLQQAVCCVANTLLRCGKPCSERLTLCSCLCSEGRHGPLQVCTEGLACSGGWSAGGKYRQTACCTWLTSQLPRFQAYRCSCSPDILSQTAPAVHGEAMLEVAVRAWDGCISMPKNSNLLAGLNHSQCCALAGSSGVCWAWQFRLEADHSPTCNTLADMVV